MRRGRRAWLRWLAAPLVLGALLSWIYRAVKDSVDRDFQKNGFENGRIAVALWRTIAADLETRP